MAEEAVNELQARRDEWEEDKTKATTNLQEAQEAAEELKGNLEEERAEKEKWQVHAEELEEQLERCMDQSRSELKDQGMQLELERLRQLEAVRQQFVLTV